MIVKVKNEKNCWSYFEGDNIIQHKYGDNSGGKTTEHREDTVYFIDEEVPVNDTIELCIIKDKKVSSRVHTNRPTYLLNDNGKTIDKLI